MFTSSEEFEHSHKNATLLLSYIHVQKNSIFLEVCQNVLELQVWYNSVFPTNNQNPVEMHVQKNSVFPRSTKNAKKRRLNVLLKSKAGVQLYYLFKGLSILPKLNYLLYKVQYFPKVCENAAELHTCSLELNVSKKYASIPLNICLVEHGIPSVMQECNWTTCSVKLSNSQKYTKMKYARMQRNYLFSKLVTHGYYSTRQFWDNFQKYKFMFVHCRK